MAAGEKGLMTPANVVTCVRVVLIPLYMWLASAAVDAAAGGTGSAPAAVAAFALYALLCATDKLDGYLARSRNEVTDFGKFLDPIADKLLVFSALLLLLQWGAVGVAGVFLILCREFLVSALRMVASSKGQVIAADKLGKAKTAVTMVSLCAYMLALPVSAMGAPLVAAALCSYVAWPLYLVAVVLTVASGVQYFWNARHVLV